MSSATAAVGGSGIEARGLAMGNFRLLSIPQGGAPYS